MKRCTSFLTQREFCLWQGQEVNHRKSLAPFLKNGARLGNVMLELQSDHGKMPRIFFAFAMRSSETM